MDAGWLKTQLKLNPGKSKAGLATAVGLSPPAISKILKGTRQIKAQEYVLMREFFGMPNDGHAATAKRENTSHMSPSMRADKAFNEDAPMRGEWLIPAGLLSGQGKNPADHLRVFEVHEALMAPNFKSGERVLVDLTDKNAEQRGAFMISDGFSTMLRYCEIVPGSSPLKVKISARENFEAQILLSSEFLIIGRVIAKLDMIQASF